jgi:dTDP-glucose 4,6-dehydratase
VTGGAGFIGANFVSQWLADRPGDRVVVLDALTYAGNLANLAGLRDHPGLQFVLGDISDQPLVESLLREHDVRTLVHFAAESHVDRSISGPDAFIATNVVGTHALLKAARQVWLVEGGGPPHRFHHVSTDEVYGSLGPDDPRFAETTPYAPNSPYSASKAASDFLVRAYHHTYGLATTISNCSNNYGPLQFPEKLIPLMLTNALRGRPLPVYGDGRNIRDWLHVRDHCRGVTRVIEGGVPGQTYNLGGDCERTNLELVGALCAAVDRVFAERPGLAKAYPQCPAATGRRCESLVEFVADRPGHDRRYAVDTSRAQRELGFAVATTLECGLRETVDWYIDHRDWWEGVLSGRYRAWRELRQLPPDRRGAAA